MLRGPEYSRSSYLWRRVRGTKAKLVRRRDLGLRQSLTFHIMNGKKKSQRARSRREGSDRRDSDGRRGQFVLSFSRCYLCLV